MNARQTEDMRGRQQMGGKTIEKLGFESLRLKSCLLMQYIHEPTCIRGEKHLSSEQEILLGWADFGITTCTVGKT